MSQTLAFVPTVLLLGVGSAVFAAGPSDTVKIQKCQDAAGKWHYGDFAAAECAKSKVEVISKEGLKKEEIAAPLTEAELADRERRKEEIDREKRSAEDKAKLDKNLLQTYAVEEDIVIVRERKLSQLEATIKASEETVKSLRAALGRLEAQKQSEDEKKDDKAAAQSEKSIAQTKSQIERHETLVAQRRKEQEQINKHYDEELRRYRELKRAPQAKLPATNPAEGKRAQ